jgi:hypothetical protein
VRPSALGGSGRVRPFSSDYCRRQGLYVEALRIKGVKSKVPRLGWLGEISQKEFFWLMRVKNKYVKE